MIIATASNAYILFFKNRPTREAILKRGRVKPGTYAEEFLSDLHAEIFLHCRELRREYQRYYAPEYLRFSLFTDNFGYLPEKLQPNADDYYARYELIIPYSTHQWVLNDEEGLRLLGKLFDLRHKTP